MKKTLLTSFIGLCLLALPAMADDGKPVSVDAGVVDAGVVDAGVVDAGVVVVTAGTPSIDSIDEATKQIDEDPVAQINLLIELAKTGRWGPFVGLLILFVVWGLRKFIWKLVNPNVLPWLTLGFAVIASIGVGLLAENVWWEVMLDSLITGGAAGIMWSALFKHFMKPKEA